MSSTGLPEEGKYTDNDPLEKETAVSTDAGEYTDSDIPGETTHHASHTETVVEHPEQP